MPRDLKVYGSNKDGRHRVFGAFPSYKAYREAGGADRAYTSFTGNAREVAIALAEPGVLFGSDQRNRVLNAPIHRWDGHQLVGPAISVDGGE